MSHDYYVRCKTCKKQTEQWNHAEQDLIGLVQQAYPLYMLTKTTWWDELQPYRYQSLREFIVKHFPCNAFEVCGEYGSDKPVPIVVAGPEAEIKKIAVDHALEKLRKATRIALWLLGIPEKVMLGTEYGPKEGQ